MGYMTTVVLLNDRFHEFADDPRVLWKIIEQDHYEGSEFPVHGVQVFSTAHADSQRLYFTWRNMGLDLSGGDQRTMRLAVAPATRKIMDEAIADARRMLDRFEERVAEIRERVDQEQETQND